MTVTSEQIPDAWTDQHLDASPLFIARADRSDADTASLLTNSDVRFALSEATRFAIFNNTQTAVIVHGPSHQICLHLTCHPAGTVTITDPAGDPKVIDFSEACSSLPSLTTTIHTDSKSELCENTSSPPSPSLLNDSQKMPDKTTACAEAMFNFMQEEHRVPDEAEIDSLLRQHNIITGQKLSYLDAALYRCRQELDFEPPGYDELKATLREIGLRPIRNKETVNRESAVGLQAAIWAQKIFDFILERNRAPIQHELQEIIEEHNLENMRLLFGALERDTRPWEENDHLDACVGQTIRNLITLNLPPLSRVKRLQNQALQSDVVAHQRDRDQVTQMNAAGFAGDIVSFINSNKRAPTRVEFELMRQNSGIDRPFEIFALFNVLEAQGLVGPFGLAIPDGTPLQQAVSTVVDYIRPIVS